MTKALPFKPGPPIHPNVGIEATYKKRLLRLVEEMERSLAYWLTARWHANPPIMAQDELPAASLQRTMEQLGKRWLSRFDEAAPALAAYFAQAARERVDGRLEEILERAGFIVDFKTSRAVQDMLRATINQNVSLITNIASEHLNKVEGAVMRSVQAGRDLHSLAEELKEIGITSRKRVALICNHQNNLATSQITRVRQLEAGIEMAIWRHSHAGKVPRPDHVAHDGKPYPVREGIVLNPKEGVCWPGSLINCRCFSQPIIPRR